MRAGVVGAIVGLVTGVVVGATVIGPNLMDRRAVTAERVTLPERPQPIEALTRDEAEQPVVEAPIRWRMSSAYAATLPLLGPLAKRVEDGVWRLSGGRMEVRVHGPGALVPREDVLDAVASGTIEAAFGSPAAWAERIPTLRLFSGTPFGPRPSEFLAWIYLGGGLELLEELYAREGVKVLVCGVAVPEAAGWFRDEIATADDLNGLTIRMQGLGAEAMGRLGANVLDIPESEIFLAFEKQEIDAAEFSLPSIDIQLGFEAFASHYYFPGWQQQAGLFNLLVNEAAWEALNPAEQGHLATVCGDNVRHSLAAGEAAQFPALKALTGKGVTIHRWPDKVLDRLRTAWREVAAEKVETDRDFERVWTSLSAFRREYAIWRELGYL